MNNIYQYSYTNGLQFVSTANIALIALSTEKEKEIPKLLGVWKYKVMKQQTNK